MTEPELSPYACGGSALADSAHNLAKTLAKGPEVENEQARSLRQHVYNLALALAEMWRDEPKPIDRERSLKFHWTLWKLRGLAVELAPSSDSNNCNIQTVLSEFCRFLGYGALITLRPTGLATNVAQDRLHNLNDRLSELNIDASIHGDDRPSRFLVVRYPHGEQHDTLMACTTLPFITGDGYRHVRSTSILGPAYFFAAAAEIQNYKGFSDAYDPPNLCFIGELLEIAGWTEHPVVGPLIQGWRQRFGFSPDFLDTQVRDKSQLQKMRDAQAEYRTVKPSYTPNDFDRAVAVMWDRLAKAQPPVDLAVWSGRGEPVPNVIDILNAGWTFAQLHLGKLYATLACSSWRDRYEARCTLNRLLAESVQQTSATGNQT